MLLPSVACLHLPPALAPQAETRHQLYYTRAVPKGFMLPVPPQGWVQVGPGVRSCRPAAGPRPLPASSARSTQLRHSPSPQDRRRQPWKKPTTEAEVEYGWCPPDRASHVLSFLPSLICHDFSECQTCFQPEAVELCRVSATGPLGAEG